MAVKEFTELRCWQSSRLWSKRIYQPTQLKPFRSDRRLVAQINDSSESVMSNIAEGFGRGTQAEFVTFLGYAIGSLNETQSHLCAAVDREYISQELFDDLFGQGTAIRKMIVALVTSMVKRGSGVKHVRKPFDFSDRVWQLYEQQTGQQRPELFRKAPVDVEE